MADNPHVNEEQISPSSPLGMRNPLGLTSSLGKSFLSPKFLSPLGSQSLLTSEPSISITGDRTITSQSHRETSETIAPPLTSITPPRQSSITENIPPQLQTFPESTDDTLETDNQTDSSTEVPQVPTLTDNTISEADNSTSIESTTSPDLFSQSASTSTDSSIEATESPISTDSITAEAESQTSPENSPALETSATESSPPTPPSTDDTLVMDEANSLIQTAADVFSSSQSHGETSEIIALPSTSITPPRQSSITENIPPQLQTFPESTDDTLETDNQTDSSTEVPQVPTLTDNTISEADNSTSIESTTSPDLFSQSASTSTDSSIEATESPISTDSITAEAESQTSPENSPALETSATESSPPTPPSTDDTLVMDEANSLIQTAADVFSSSQSHGETSEIIALPSTSITPPRQSSITENIPPQLQTFPESTDDTLETDNQTDSITDETEAHILTDNTIAETDNSTSIESTTSPDSFSQSASTSTDSSVEATEAPTSTDSTTAEAESQTSPENSSALETSATESSPITPPSTDDTLVMDEANSLIQTAADVFSSSQSHGETSEIIAPPSTSITPPRQSSITENIPPQLQTFPESTDDTLETDNQTDSSTEVPQVPTLTDNTISEADNSTSIESTTSPDLFSQSASTSTDSSIEATESPISTDSITAEAESQTSPENSPALETSATESSPPTPPSTDDTLVMDEANSLIQTAADVFSSSQSHGETSEIIAPPSTSITPPRQSSITENIPSQLQTFPESTDDTLETDNQTDSITDETEAHILTDNTIAETDNSTSIESTTSPDSFSQSASTSTDSSVEATEAPTSTDSTTAEAESQTSPENSSALETSATESSPITPPSTDDTLVMDEANSLIQTAADVFSSSQSHGETSEIIAPPSTSITPPRQSSITENIPPQLQTFPESTDDTLETDNQTDSSTDETEAHILTDNTIAETDNSTSIESTTSPDSFSQSASTSTDSSVEATEAPTSTDSTTAEAESQTSPENSSALETSATESSPITPPSTDDTLVMDEANSLIQTAADVFSSSQSHGETSEIIAPPSTSITPPRQSSITENIPPQLQTFPESTDDTLETDNQTDSSTKVPQVPTLTDNTISEADNSTSIESTTSPDLFSQSASTSTDSSIEATESPISTDSITAEAESQTSPENSPALETSATESSPPTPPSTDDTLVMDEANSLIQTAPEDTSSKTIPEIPISLKNLASRKPLGLSNSLTRNSHLPVSSSLSEFSPGVIPNVQSKQNMSENSQNEETEEFDPQPEQSINLQPDSYVPSSWLNINELLGNNSARSLQNYTKELSGYQISAKPANEEAGDYIENPREGEISDFEQGEYYTIGSGSNDISSLIQMSTVTAGEQGATSETTSSSSNSSQQNTHENSASEDAKNFEILAREIYALIRQRIEIERERQGNYY